MGNCQRCNKPFKKISKTTKMYPDLPFEENLPFNFCDGCGEKHLDNEIKELIDNLEDDVRCEYTGETWLRFLDAKDFLIEEHSAKSILGEAPKGIYLDPKKSKRYLVKWSKVKPDGFNHGFRELVTELIMNKMSEKVTFTASSALCKIDEVPVFVTESFINESKGDYLVHGVEIFRNLYGDDKKIDAIQKTDGYKESFIL